MKNWKLIVSIIISIGTIFGAAYYAEDRWNQSSKVEAAEFKVIAMEKQTIQTLETFQKQQTLRFEMQQEQFLGDMLFRNKMERRKFPNDLELKQEEQELRERRTETKKNISELLE